MKAAEDRLGDDAVPVRNSALRRHGNESGAVWNTRPEARVRTPGVVMGHTLAKNGSEMILAHRNHPIEALAPNGANEPFAKGIGLWRTCRRLQDRQPHRLDRAIEGFGVDAVVVVNEESLGIVA